MTTLPERTVFRRLAVECLVNQAKTPRYELIVALEQGSNIGLGAAARLARHNVAVKMVYGAWKTLTDKQNEAVAASAAPWFILWADDDWSAEDRLAACWQAAKKGVDIVGADVVHYHELIGEHRRLVRRTSETPVVDGIGMIRRVVWDAWPFRATKSIHPRAHQMSNVMDWAAKRAASGAVVARAKFQHVAMIHAGNTMMPTRPFRVDEVTGEVWDGPEYTVVPGGRNATAKLMTDKVLQYYESAAGVSPPVSEADVGR